MVKNRLHIGISIMIIIILGLATRTSIAFQIMPVWLAKGLGDALWSTMFYMIFLFIAPRMKVMRLIVITIVFSWLIEFSQILQIEWLMNLRDTPLRYLLGQGFHWEDLGFYVIGTGIAAILDWFLFHKREYSS